MDQHTWEHWHQIEKQKEEEFKQLIDCHYLDSKNLFNARAHSSLRELKQHIRIRFIADNKYISFHIWVDHSVKGDARFISTDIGVYSKDKLPHDDFDGHLFDIHDRWMNAETDRQLLKETFGNDSELVERCLNIIMRYEDRLNIAFHLS
jgi:hypothetical protein